MKKQIFLTGLFMLAAGMLFGQIDKMKEVLEDELSMQDGEGIRLRIFDAVTVNPVQAATLQFRHAGSHQTDMDGTVQLPMPEKDGTYPFEFSADGYITAVYRLEVIGGTVFHNRFHVSPVLEIGTVRLVLEWGRRPADLDLHLIKTNGYHISYRNMRSSTDGQARLDRDARNGFGPETITIADLDETAEYRCYVHDFSNRERARSRALSRSDATLRVYAEGELWGTFEIDEVQKGNTWEVFRILNGEIIPEGEVKVRR